MKAFTQMKEAAFGDKPRERRSSAKLSDWTGPTEATEEDGKKEKRSERMWWGGRTDQWMIDGWIVDEVMVPCCALRQMRAYRGGVWGFCLRWKRLYKAYSGDVAVKAIVLTPGVSSVRACTCVRLHLLSIPVLVAGPVCMASWHIFLHCAGLWAALE